MDIKARQNLFQNPTREYKGKPFWSWNGTLEEEELKRQIDIMEQMGFGGYFMHSRTGLATEYLGNDWFHLINECADYGNKKGMESWLYDEDRWPSGSAGGIVTRDERYRAKHITMVLKGRHEYEDMQWTNDITAVYACKMKDGILLEKRQMIAGEHLEPEEKAVLFFIEDADCSDNYNGFTYLDTMNKEAVEQFIQVTHENYKNRCGDKFGKEILGIFTDEPHRGFCFTDFSDGRSNQAPYTPVLFTEFERRFGYSLVDNLPELFLRKQGAELSKVTYDYLELCQQLFIDNFAKPIYDWCKNNHLLFTGHVLHEDSLCAQTIMQGSLMRFYEYMDYPGVDVLTESNDCYWIVKQVSSVARQLDKKWVLSELYGCTGWQMNLESYKNVGDWQALFGVNLRCPHLSWYTMKGEAKRDYPASILHQSPWYRDYHYLEDYFSRIHAALWEGTPDCSVLVISPVESIWGRAYSGAFTGLDGADIEILRIEKQYRELFHWLAGNQIDFDYGDEDIMNRHACVKEGLLYVGSAAYQKVLVAGLDTIRSTTLNLLEDYMKQGGVVIFAGGIPAYTDAVKSDRAKEMARRAKVIPMNECSVAHACTTGKEILIQLEGEQKKWIFVRSWQMRDGRMIMVLNTNRTKAIQSLRINLGNGSCAERWDPREGNIYHANYQQINAQIEIVIDLEAGGERLYFITDVRRDLPNEPQPVKRSLLEGGEYVVLPEHFSYQLTEPNICVLDQVRISSEQGLHISETEVLKADRLIRDYFHMPYRGGEMLQPWFEKKYGCKTHGKEMNLTLEYGVEVDKNPTKVELVVEDADQIDRLLINGIEIPVDMIGKWIDICFDRISIPDHLWKIGRNTITIALDYHKTSGLEAVYLLGEFAVELTEAKTPIITSLPDQLQIGDITALGFPFYSGSIQYEMEGFQGSNVEVTVGNFGGSLIKLLGEKETILAFPPYCKTVENLKGIEVVLTRRNTFGPLHQLPKKAHAYGPGNYITEDGNWSESYILYEQGLLEKPLIKRLL